jgi:adenylate kinase family enzyme
VVLFGIGDDGEAVGLAGTLRDARARLTDHLRDLITPSAATVIETHCYGRPALLAGAWSLLQGSLAWMSDIPRAICVGRRVVVTGMAGAGKSTFSRALSAKTGLPVIVLDACFWLPGWAKPAEAEWREKQNRLLAGEDWIADGNYHATLDLRLGRTDTVVFLDMPWRICAWRALVRGVRTRPAGFELPEGCGESRWRRLRDEWCLAWRIWQVRRSERETELTIVSQHGQHAALYVLGSKRAVREFLGL